MSEKDNAITVLPSEPEPKQVATLAPGGAIASIADIEQLVARAKYMGEQLDKLRQVAIARTFPSDWKQMGDSCYLEGDGGLRLAPVIGLQITNLMKREEPMPNGHIRVTYTCNASSTLFGNYFEGIERTRCTDDQFLSRGTAKADIEDIRSAVYKGLVAKAAQYCMGVSGLTPEELEKRYGMKPGAKVEYQTGKADAKAADKAAASPALAEIHRMLRKLSAGEPDVARDLLEGITVNKEKGWPAKSRPEDLTENGVKFVTKKLKELEAQFDAALVAAEGGRE